MSSLRNIPLHVLMLAGLLASQEAVAGEAKPAQPEAKAAAPAAPEAKLQAYAGISVNAYSGYQRERDPVASVPEGIGLYVGFVDPEGPAAGKLQEKDVLTRLDDQVLVNAEQFRALLQTRKSGDTIKLVRVRGDDIDTVELQLTGKPAPTLRATTRGPRGFSVDPSDPVISGTGGIRIMVNGQEIDPGQMAQGGAVRLGPGAQGNVIVIDPNSAQLPAEARKMLEDMRKRGMPVPPDAFGGAAPVPDEITVGGAPGASKQVIVRSFSFGSSGANSSSSSMYSDDEGTVSIRKEGEKKFATVKDAEGKALFEGEISTEEQLKGLAETVRSRIAMADGHTVRIPGVSADESPESGTAKATSPKPAAGKKKAKRDPQEGA